MSLSLAARNRRATAVPATTPPPEQTRRRISIRWRGAVTVVLVLAFWEVASRTGVLPSSTIPAASQVFEALFAQLGQASFWAAVGKTLASTGAGLGVVILIAVPLSLLIGLSRIARESSWLVIEFLKPIPPVAMIPLGLLLWGPSETMKITLIAFGALWPLLTQMIYGVNQVDHVALDMAKSYRLKTWLTTSHIVIPSLLPFAATGLRVSTSIAVVVAVVTELIGGAAGLGREIVIAQSAGNLPVMYALILTTGILGLLINGVFAAAERPLLFWHPTHRKDTGA